MTGKMRNLEADLAANSDIDCEIRRDVAFITIARPAEGNRLTPASLVRLRSLAAQLATDRRTNCVVITGAGSEYFSSGIFNIELRSAYAKHDVLEIVRLANEAFDSIEALPQVVIAALNGTVRAGGGELALACDVRLCATHATLAFHETSYACFPGAGAPVRLPAIVGAAAALEIISMGRELDSGEMLQLGLVTRVVRSSELQDVATNMAVQIAAKGPLGVRGAKRIIQARVRGQVEAAQQLSLGLRSALEYSYDVDEAIAAHREQRPAKYLGR